MMDHLKILVVDDEPNLRELLKNELGRNNWVVSTAAGGAEALEMYREQIYNVVILDVLMPGMDGIETLRRMRQETDIPEVIMLTGHGTIENAVECIKLGSYDYLTKPVKLDELEMVILKAAEKNALRLENISLRVGAEMNQDYKLVCKSSQMMRILEMVRQLGAEGEHVLITGESGTGKELVARAVHFASPRKRKPFLVLNAGRLSVHTSESELFGHVRGAFTGAVKNRAGMFELANTGTLFLDEISEMPLDVQVKLLRILETGKFRRLGGAQDIEVDVRFVFASNKELGKCVKAGTFREDLYHRINLLTINLPPLRERRDDIPVLAKHFITQRDQTGKIHLNGEAMDSLLRHDWPGNVRELRNAIFRACILSKNGEIKPELFPFWSPRQVACKVEGDNGVMALKEVERLHICKVLERTGGNKSRAAQLLEIDRKTLYTKIEKYALEN